MTKKRPPVIGVILGFIAAAIGFLTTCQLLNLAFLPPPPGIPWEQERAELIEDWIWMIRFSPLLAIPMAIIASISLILLHHFQRTDCLAHVVAGAVTGLLWGSTRTSLLWSSTGMPTWAECALIGAVSALSYWIVLQLYKVLVAFPVWLTRWIVKGPPNEV